GGGAIGAGKVGVGGALVGDDHLVAHGGQALERRRVGLQRHVARVRELALDLDIAARRDRRDRAEIARRDLREEDVLAVGGGLEEPRARPRRVRRSGGGSEQQGERGGGCDAGGG